MANHDLLRHFHEEMQSFQTELSARCNPSTFLIQLKIKMGTTPPQKKKKGKRKQTRSLVQKWEPYRVVSQEAAAAGLTPSPHSFWDHGSFKEHSGRSTGRYLEKLSEFKEQGMSWKSVRDLGVISDMRGKKK